MKKITIIPIMIVVLALLIPFAFAENETSQINSVNTEATITGDESENNAIYSSNEVNNGEENGETIGANVEMDNVKPTEEDTYNTGWIICIGISGIALIILIILDIKVKTVGKKYVIINLVLGITIGVLITLGILNSTSRNNSMEQMDFTTMRQDGQMQVPEGTQMQIPDNE